MIILVFTLLLLLFFFICISLSMCSRSAVKHNNNINCLLPTFVVTPQDAIKSKQDKATSKNNTSTPLDVSIKTQINNKRSRVKSAKYSKEEFIVIRF